MNKKYFSIILTVILLFSLFFGHYTVASKTEEKAFLELEKAEALRAGEEIYLQMGVGLSDDLRNKYEELITKYSDSDEIVGWSKFRIAEHKYSRDQFDIAIAELNGIAKKYKGMTVALEAELLEAEIWDSPYNNKRNTEKAQQILAKSGQSHTNNIRIKSAELSKKAEKEMRTNKKDKKKQNKKDKESIRLELKDEVKEIVGKHKKDKSNNKEKKYMKKHVDKKTKHDIAKIYKDIALAQAEDGDYQGSYETIDELVNDSDVADESFDYFTFTSSNEELTYQKILALLSENSVKKAEAELVTFKKKYPDSYLIARAEVKLSEINKVKNKNTKMESSEMTNSLSEKVNDVKEEYKELLKLDSACGPAALQVALAELGLQKDIITLIKNAKTTENGTTMSGLINASKLEGKNLYGLKIKKSSIRNVSTPSILLLKDHFVTLTKVSGNSLVLFDPTKGHITEDYKDFQDNWDGYILVFAESDKKALASVKGSELLTNNQLEDLRGRYACSNAGGDPLMNSDPCNNFNKLEPSSDGEWDGFEASVHRFYGNFHVKSTPLIFNQIDAKLMDLNIYYNSQAATRDSDTGLGWTISYSDHLIPLNNGNMQLVTSDGTRNTFLKNIDNSYTSPSGVFDKFQLNSDNTYSVIRKDKSRFNFDTDGKLIQKVDKNNQGVSIKYNALNKIDSITDSNNVSVSFEYTDKGKISSIKSGEGQKADFKYNSSNSITEVVLPDSRVIKFNYTDKLLSNLTDSSGNQTKFSYGGFGAQSLTAIENANRDIKTYSDGEKIEYSGATIKYTFDSLRRVISEKDALGNITRYTYTPDNQVSTVIDALGNQTKYFYDAKGNITTLEDALGNQTHYLYNESGLVTKAVDSLGRETLYSYDQNGNLLSTTNAVGKSLSYQYNENGKVLQITDYSGEKTHYSYNKNGLLASVTNALGNTMKYEYDEIGRKTAEIDDLGRTTSFLYDGNGNVIEKRFPNNSSETYSYQKGKLVGFTDRNGNETINNLDNLGRVIETVDPLEGTTQYSYDKHGNEVEIMNPNGQKIKKVYDLKNRLIEIIYPDESNEKFVYDKNDRLINKTDITGLHTIYTYDALGRIIRTEKK